MKIKRGWEQSTLAQAREKGTLDGMIGIDRCQEELDGMIGIDRCQEERKEEYAFTTKQVL